ncbi:MAG: hypothetical protein AABZ31_10090 [Bdellovibrionota bacterium]|mgnify:CR=1 FL=1
MKKMSLNLISLILGLSCLVAGEAFSASLDDVKVCEKTLKARAFSPEELHPSFKMVGQPSVKVTGRQTRSSQQEFILELTGREWSSAATSKLSANTPQGDPRAIIFILGPELAHFLGFSFIDEKHMTVPSLESFNEKVLLLNEALVKLGYKPIPVRMYLTHKAFANNETYSREFADKGGIAISPDLAIFLHDVSFHMPTVAMPADFLNSVIQFSSAHYHFIKFLEGQISQSRGKNRKAYTFALPLLRAAEPIFLDNLLGATVRTLFENKTDSDFNQDSARILTLLFENFFAMDTFDNQRLDVLTMVLSRFDHMNNSVMYVSEDPEDHISQEEIYTILKNLLSKFMRQNPGFNWRQPIPKYEGASFIADTEARLLELQAALNKIRAGDGN